MLLVERNNMEILSIENKHMKKTTAYIHHSNLIDNMYRKFREELEYVLLTAKTITLWVPFSPTLVSSYNSSFIVSSFTFNRL